MKRMLVAVAAAVVAFVLVGAPSGVLRMIDPRYCFDHPERPETAVSHEEMLSFVPPGPVCAYDTLGGTVRVGPDWWPAVAAAGAIVAGVAAFRLRSRPNAAGRRSSRGRTTRT